MDLSKWMEKNPDKINMVSEGKATVSTELKERVNAKSTPVSLPQTDGRTNWINENRVKPNTSSAEIKENINIQSAKSLRNSLIKQRQEREASFLRAGTLGTEMMKQDETLKNLRSKIATLDVDINTAEKEEKAQNYKQYTIHDGYSSGKNDGSTMGTILAIANRTGQNIGNIGAAYVEKYMTDEERGILKQVLREDGDNAALEYLDFLQEDLNYRKAQSDVAEIEKEPDILKPIITGAYAASSGIDQYLSGTKQLFSEERLPTSSVQYASGMVREGIDSKAGRVAYDLINTTANMAPSILASVVLGGAGAPQVVSGLASSGMIGASAGGNAYNQALEQGYSKEAARTYGTLVGASEAGLQYVLGGISKLGSGAVSNKIAQSVANIDNALLRVAATLGESALSEGTEEGLQEILDPVFKELILDKDGQVQIVPEDVAYSFLLGALSAGLFEGGSAAANAISNKISNTQPLQNDMPNIEATRNEESEGSLYPAQENAAEGQNNANIDPLVEAIIAEQKNNASEGETSDKTLISVMKNAIPQIKNMKAVADVTGNEMPRVGTVVDRITNFISSIGNKVTRQGFGEVLFSRSKIKSSMIGHGIGDAKIETFAAVPAVIQYGEQIDYQKNWKGRNYDTYVFAAPIEYKGQKSYLGVVVIKDSRSNRYYVHEVTDGKGNIIYKNPAPISDGTSALAGDLDTVMGTGFADALRNSRPGVTAQGGVTGTAETSNIDYNIPQSENYVNNDGIGAANAGFDPWSNAENKYGTFENEHNAVRLADMPVSTDGENRVSQTVSTAKGAMITPEEFVPLLENAVMEEKGGFTFDSIKNTEVMSEAQQDIMYNGWDASLSEWTRDVSQGKVSPKNEVIGMLLYNNAVNSGNNALAMDILSTYSASGTNIARSLQIRRMLRQMTPETRLLGIKQSIEKLSKQLNLGFTPVFSEEVQQEYLNAKTEAERDSVITKMANELTPQLPSATLLEQWNSLRYACMLGNFKTQTRNFAGNLVMMALARAKDLVAVGIEKAAGGERTKAILTKSEADKARIAAAKAQFANDKKLAMGEAKYSDGKFTPYQTGDAAEIISKAMEQRRRFGFNNPQTAGKKLVNAVTAPVEAWSRATSRAMEKGDAIFSKATFVHALAGYMKANNITAEQWGSAEWQKNNIGIVNKARTYAIKEAQEATFRDSTAFSNWVSKVGRRKSSPKIVKAVSEGLLPFRKTPANVLVRAEEYSPLGFINAAVMEAQKNAYDKAVKQGKDTSKMSGADISGTDIINQLSKAITGTGVFVLGVLLRNAGIINGGDDKDDDQKYFDNLNGYQPYSINLPNGYSYTLSWASPSAMPFFMGAQFADAVADGGFQIDDIWDSMTSIAEPMLQMSMISGVSDALDSLKYGDDSLVQFAGTLALSYLTQGLTSTLGGQIERITEANRMSTYTQNTNSLSGFFNKQIGKTSAKIPGFDYEQYEYVDAWGRTESNGDVLTRVVTQMFSPGYVSKDTKGKVENELQRIADSTGSTAVFPDLADKSFVVKGETKNLNKEEYVKYAKKKGQDSYKIVKEIIESSDYKKLDDEGKADAIGKAYEYANAMAKKTVSDYEVGSTSWINKAEKTIKSKNISIAQYIVDYTLGKQDKKEEEADKYDYDALLAALIAQ